MFVLTLICFISTGKVYLRRILGDDNTEKEEYTPSRETSTNNRGARSERESNFAEPVENARAQPSTSFSPSPSSFPSQGQVPEFSDEPLLSQEELKLYAFYYTQLALAQRKRMEEERLMAEYAAEIARQQRTELEGEEDGEEGTDDNEETQGENVDPEYDPQQRRASGAEWVEKGNQADWSRAPGEQPVVQTSLGPAEKTQKDAAAQLSGPSQGASGEGGKKKKRK